ncbi:MAG TPA: hypothetical protein DEO70_06190 [Bacteroidales bacterium]|nr:MAG: hypothetical protein A2X11_08235 [Bacteroidetes bacterium GWE2_42_24]OFY31106.1 MAG: hypothetical protein A2X09_15540 [Bacteroidetes bacterium GWF2_43_11]HBZ66410.1 hypothetical protein [Bacteroidales bacterium]
MILMLSGLFLFRVVYGLCSEFWFEDELQIYLIGLKYYTTGLWPYYGPDVVYTQTQIPGALQGLLAGGSFIAWAAPESPILLVNILSFGSLCLFGWYISRRFHTFPKWMIYVWLMMAPWTINYGTRVVNPSYVIIFAIPFFVGFIDLYTNKCRLIPRQLVFFVLGLMLTLIMQLHLSWVLLVPFAGYAFLIQWHHDRSRLLSSVLIFVIGLLAGAATMVPTLLQPWPVNRGVESNVVLNRENIKNIFTVLMRYLAFASAEVNYWLGGNTASRLAVVKDQLWMAPAVIFLLVAGFAQVILFVVAFFQKNTDEGWVRIKWITVAAFLLVYLSFFFSIKGPSSHTFIIMMPVPMFYSFYCYEWLLKKRRTVWHRLLVTLVLCTVAFNIGMALNGYHTRSLYRDREKVKQAIEQRDYHLLGERRSDAWGYR